MDDTDVDSLPVQIYDVPAPIRDHRESYQKQRALYLILASTLFERIAFYSLVANIVRTLKSSALGWSPPDSITALYIFSGISYLSTLIFAVISDYKLGRAKTIVIGFIVYLIGYISITAIAAGISPRCNFEKANGLTGSSIIYQSCGPEILATLIFTAIGVGAVQSNMAVFGAEQIQELQITARYFDKYMVAANIGGIIATSGIPYVQAYTNPSYVVFLITTCMLFIAFILFIIGWRYYLHIKPYDTVVIHSILVVINACQSWCRYKQRENPVERDNINDSEPLLYSSQSLSGREDSMRAHEPPPEFIDYAKASHSGKFPDRIVNDVKSFRGALIVFILLIPYWLIYNQLDATFPLQAQQMSGLSARDMVTWISLGDPVTFIIGIVVLKLIGDKYFDTQKPIMSITTKFVIGMSFATLTMCITGSIEISRQHHCPSNKNESSLTIYAQLPQYIGMGLSELFAMIASYEFAYFAAPRSAQSLFMSLRFCSLGISSFISTGYMYIFPTTFIELDFRCLSPSKWQWSFYAYFYILAGLQLPIYSQHENCSKNIKSSFLIVTRPVLSNQIKKSAKKVCSNFELSTTAERQNTWIFPSQ